MRLLLTSAGIKNASINDALVGLLGKPIAESSALCIPTAAYGHPLTPGVAWRFISGREPRTPMCELGWKSLGVLELTALPSIDEEQWVPLVRETDVLLVGGGDALYLCHWMRQSGLADLLPSLRETVYVGLSAGSMVMTPRIGEDFVFWRPPTGGDRSAGDRRLFDLSAPGSREHAGQFHGRGRKMGRRDPGPAYAIDDQTAIKVTDGTVEVVSEGNWKLFALKPRIRSLPQSRRMIVSSISSPRPCAKPRSTPTRRNPAFSSTRSEPTLSEAALANTGRSAVSARRICRAALAMPFPHCARSTQ